MLARKILPVVLVLMAVMALTAFHVQARPHDDRLDGGRASTSASARLMKELKDFFSSDSYEKGLLAVELVDDNIYEWHVRYFVNNPELLLFKDLQELKANGGPDHILLHVKYNANYPSEPPFVRVVYPHLTNGILFGGAICHELLSKSGWNSQYNFESLILQLAAEKLNRTKMFKGDMTDFPEYTQEEAEKNFDKVVRTHEGNGYWTTTPEPSE